MRENLSRSKILIIILAALLAIGAFGLVMYLVESHSLADEQFGDTGDWGEEEPETTELSLGDKLYISNDNLDTYLIIGTDSGGEDLGEMFNGELADFVTLLLVDNTTKKFAFLQFDRNTMVRLMVPDADGNTTAMKDMQLCIAHWYGKNADDRNRNTADAVSSILGDLDIENWYSLEMTDIGAVNHAIGGVVVDIDEDMTSVDPAFTKGATVLLSDEQAEKYIRARMNVGDGTNKARMSRQTQYMQKAYNLVMSQLRDNPEYINQLYSELEGRINSGESEGNFSRMANQILTYESLGIMQFDGRTEINDTVGEGIEHEEFYVSERSILNNLRKVMNLKEAPEDYGE